MNLVLWCHYVPGAGDTSRVVLLRPVGCFECPRGLVQSPSTVLVACGEKLFDGLSGIGSK